MSICSFNGEIIKSKSYSNGAMQRQKLIIYKHDKLSAGRKDVI